MATPSTHTVRVYRSMGDAWECSTKLARVAPRTDRVVAIPTWQVRIRCRGLVRRGGHRLLLRTTKHASLVLEFLETRDCVAFCDAFLALNPGPSMRKPVALEPPPADSAVSTLVQLLHEPSFVTYVQKLRVIVQEHQGMEAMLDACVSAAQGQE